MQKKVTLTNIELVNAATALQVLCQQEQATTPKFRLLQNKKALEAHAIEYQEFRTELLNEFGEKDEDGQIKVNDKGVVIFPTPEKQKEATEKINELNQLTVDVNYQSIVINSMTATGVQTDVLETLLWMFEEPE